MSGWPARVLDERVSLARISAGAAAAPWLDEAEQAIAGRAEPCRLKIRLDSGDAGYWICADTAGRRVVVGALSGRLAGNRAIWTWLAVDAQWRAFGFGGAAVPLFERAARQLGAREALAPLPADNGVALYFWLRLGYAPERSPTIAAADIPPGVAAHAVWMRRPLDGARKSR